MSVHKIMSMHMYYVGQYFPTLHCNTYLYFTVMIITSMHAPLDGPDIVGGIQFELKTAPNVDPPVFQLTCTSSTAPATIVQWSKDGSPVSGGSSSQIVTDTVEATYINELTVTGRQSGTYTCTIITWRAVTNTYIGSTTHSLTVQSMLYR